MHKKGHGMKKRKKARLSHTRKHPKRVIGGKRKKMKGKSGCR